VLAWSLAIHAQAPPAPASAPESCGLAPASASSSEDAAQLYRQFECRFLRGDYQGGLPFLQKACTLTSSPRCAFNLGAVHHALMHCELARAYYSRYLELAPYDENGAAARDALAELRVSCPSAPSAAAVPVGPALSEPPSGLVVAPLTDARPMVEDSGRALATPAAAAHPPAAASSSRTLSWCLLGAGAATGAMTLVALLHGARADQDATARDRQNGSLGLADDAQLRSIDHEGHRANQLAWGFGSASLLLLGAGATLLFVDFGEQGRLSVSSEQAAGISYERAF
jgi:hypothetical protein